MTKSQLIQATVNLYSFLKSLGKSTWETGHPPAMNRIARGVLKKAVQGKSKVIATWHHTRQGTRFIYRMEDETGCYHYQHIFLSLKDLETAFRIADHQMKEFSVSLFPTNPTSLRP